VLVSQVSVIATMYTSCWSIWFEMSVLLRMDLALVMLIAVVVDGLICGFDVNMTGIRLSSFVWIACARSGLLVDDWLQWPCWCKKTGTVNVKGLFRLGHAV